MSESLFQDILGWSLVVGSIALIIVLASWCVIMVCEFEGWSKTWKFFNTILNVTQAIGVVVFIVLVALCVYSVVKPCLI